ncbi:MAG: ATP-dependent helicase [Pyrinomonadaceae bacterium]
MSATKNRGEDFEDYAAQIEYADERKSAIARVFKMYEERLNNSNALDFDDLLIKTVRLLRGSKEVREKYNNKFKYILVDEYQDTNALQLSLIKYLTEKQQNICVVGDDAQSIYGFRQADIRNILDFEQHYPNAKVILLEQNYRSTQTILDVAHAIIENNVEQKKKKLWTDNPAGEKIFYHQAFDGDGEARFVAQKIDHYRRRQPKDKFAILYRTNAQSRVFEEALRRARIEYNIVGGFSFYARAEVKDVIAYLKLALNPFDDIALLRVINTPTRGLGKTSLDELAFRAKDFGTSLWETIAIITDAKYEQPRNLTPRAIEALKNFKKIIENLQTKVSEFAQTEQTVSQIVIAAIEDTGYAGMLRAENSDEANARIENLDELVNAAVDYDQQEAAGLRDFIDHAALSSDTDKYDRSASVTMMTVHAAKGLEFPVVFLVGLEDGIFPHSRSINDPKELEEERRLAYVAITRAEKVLYITHSMRRRIYGEEIAAEPSQFLNEMPLEMIEDTSRGASWLSFKRSANVQNNKQTAKILRGEEKQFEKPKNLYTGKTYDSADAIAEFFKSKKESDNDSQKPTISRPSALDNLKAASSQNQSKIQNPKSKIEPGFVPGSHVRHSKYGKGLVLRREGTGDQVKLTISFPGFGQKKLIEKFANLEKA